MIKKEKKFCPKCGAELKKEDDYCIKCGYSFKKRKKKLNLKKILIAIAILIILWVAIRLFSGDPILPQPILDLFKK